MSHKLLKSILLLFLIILTIVYSTHFLIDTDAWRHLRMGLETVKNRTPYFEDRFAYTQTSPINFNFDWLFGVFLYISYLAGGIIGMEAFKCIITVSIILLLFYISLKKMSYLAAISLSLFVLIVIYPRFAERPQILSVLLSLVYLFILDRYKYEGKELLWCLPLLQILWVNLHSYYIFGIAFIWLYLISETIAAFIPPTFVWFNNQSRIRGRRYKQLLRISFASILACFVNPYSFHMIVSFLPFGISSMFLEKTAISRYIAELQPLGYFPDAETFAFKGLVGLCLFSLLLNRRRLSIQHIILFITAGYITLPAVKNIDISGIIMGYLIALNLTVRFNIKTEGIDRPKIAASFALLFVIGWLICATVLRSIFTQTGADLKYGFFASEARFPVKAAKFIEENNIGGNMFNEHSIGDYLMWRLFPQRQVFMDGRGISDDLLNYYMDVFKYRKTAEDLKKRYNINYFILPHEREDSKRLARLLYTGADFKLVYLDEVSAVFLKDTPENKPLIEKYQIDLSKQSVTSYQLPSTSYQFIKPYPYAFINRARLYSFLGFNDIAIEEIKAAISISPSLSYLYNELGVAYKQKGMIDDAIVYYKKALKLKSNYYDAIFNLALAYEEKKLIHDALKEYKKIPSSAGGIYADARRNMGVIYYNAAMYTKAEEAAKQALGIAPKDAGLHFNLGSVYAATGRLSAAKRKMEQALKINPDLKEAINGLKEIESTIDKENKKDNNVK